MHSYEVIDIKASEHKWVNSDNIECGVNALRLGDLKIILKFSSIRVCINQFVFEDS